MAASLPIILIADDHPPMRRMIKAVVQDLGSQFFEASSGEESLAACRAHQPDFVLMDLSMPGMGGIEATRRLSTEFPAARVIVVTHQNLPVLRDAAQAAGACAYVLKENLLQLRGLLVQGTGGTPA